MSQKFNFLKSPKTKFKLGGARILRRSNVTKNKIARDCYGSYGVQETLEEKWKIPELIVDWAAETLETKVVLLVKDIEKVAKHAF